VAAEDQPGPFAPEPPPEGVPLIYMNWLRTVGTAGDIAIDVGYQGGNDIPTPSVRLAMTWEHAKLLYESLGDAIGQFEADNEKIRDLKKHLIKPPRPTNEDREGGPGQ
jgi:hypothetical protein